jgi:hypothetical protein
MAERRMFAKSIVLSDAFLDMPMSARCLYFTLGMLADDDGFVGNPKSIMRQCGASKDDMNILLNKRYVLGFESGVIVIKHWRMNNYLQNDRHKPTTYLEELSTLDVDNRGAYTEKKGMYTECIQNVYTGKYSIDKDSIGKVSIDKGIQTADADKSYSYTSHTNLSNYLYLLSTCSEDYINYFKDVKEIDEITQEWMRYKDEKKPKSNNHYEETGLKSLLKKIFKMCAEYGKEEVVTVISDSMSNNYQGIIWDHIKKKQKKQSVFEQIMSS